METPEPKTLAAFFRKPVVILTLTFLLGMAVGALSVGLLVRKIGKEARFMKSEAKFKRRLYKMIEPDDRQRDSLDPIIARHYPSLKKKIVVFNDNIESEVDSMLKEMKPHLRREQIDELELKIDKFRRFKRE